MNHRKSDSSSGDPPAWSGGDSESEKDYSCENEEMSDFDSDDDPEEDEDEESDGTDTMALVDQVESSFLALLDQTVDQIEQEDDNYITGDAVQVVQVVKATRDNVRDQETQTDVTQDADVRESNAVDEEKIRLEISSLRQARESLVSHKMEIVDRIKKKNSENEEADEKKLYEYDEAIEAVDHAIDFKNEALLGRDCILSNCVAPGTSEADLVTRLTNLNTLDLQRLLCKLFAKVVEIRYSSKRLEKNNEELEDAYNKEMRLFKQYLKETKASYENNIKACLGFNSKNPHNSVEKYIKYLNSQLEDKRKIIYDLQCSLKELFCHGYIRNEANDPEVQQLAKVLGVDTGQIGDCWRMDDKDRTQQSSSRNGRSRGISPNTRFALEYGNGVLTSRRNDGLSGRRAGISAGSNGHSSRSSHKSKDHRLQEIPDSRRRKHQSPEVKRTKDRLIIRNLPDH